MRFFGLDPRRIGGAFFGGLLLGTPLASAAEQAHQPPPKSLAPSRYEQMVVQESFFDLSDPSLTPPQADYWAKAKGPGPKMEPAQGALFGVHGPHFLHVEQGIIPDCYVAASFAATAAVRPEILYQLLLADEGEYRVHLWDLVKDEAGHPRWIRETYGPVDADFLVFPEGFESPRKALYGAPSQTLAKADRAHWWPLIEKAMAAGLEKDTDFLDLHVGERGSYGDLGRGGDAGKVLGKIFGARGFRWGPLFDVVQRQLDARLPVVASTADVTPEDRLRELGVGSPQGVPDVWKKLVPEANLAVKLWKKYGITENHDYAVLGYQIRDGRPKIRVYNPSWEQHIPTAANRGGVLELSQEEFETIFSGIFSVREPEPRHESDPPTS